MQKIIIYDFDGTLTPYPAPKFEILEKCGIVGGASNKEYKEKALEISIKEKKNVYLALYEVFFNVIRKAGYPLNNESFSLGSKNVKYNKGVENFLHRAKEKNIKNYLLSSGIKIFLEGTTIAPYFEDIYASTFLYNNKKEAIGVDFLMNEENKVEAIKDILKKNNLSDNNCSSIIYIGDGLTDLKAMEFIKKNKGTNILVYTKEDSEVVSIMKEKGIIHKYFKADYEENSELSKYIDQIQ